MAQAGEGKPGVHNRVKALRRDAGLSREELAAATEIGEPLLGRIERRDSEPRVSVALRLAAYFDLPVGAVFSEEPLPPLTQTLRELHAHGDGKARP